MKYKSLAFRLGEKAVVAVLCWMLSGVASGIAFAKTPNAAEKKPAALLALDDALTVGRTVAYPAFESLVNAVKQFRADDGAQPGPLRKSYPMACEALKSFGKAIEDVAGEFRGIEPTSFESFYTAVVDYYQLKGLLHETLDAAVIIDDFPLYGMPLEELDLELPSDIADRVVGAQAARSAGGGESFDISFRLSVDECTDCSASKKRLSFSARELSAFRMNAFSLLPDKQTPRKVLTFQALKKEFANQAMLNSYLYADEKADIKLASNTDPLLNDLLERANAMAKESLYRENANEYIAKSLDDAMGASRPAFEAQAEALFHVIGRIFFNKINFEKLGGFVSDKIAAMVKKGDPLSLTVATGALARAYVSYEKKGRKEAIISELRLIPEYLIELPSERLGPVIESAVRAVARDYLSLVIEQGLLDLDKLSWKEKSILFMLTSGLADAYFNSGMIPPEVLTKLDEKRSQNDMITSLRRYKLAEKILAGVDAIDAARKKMERIKGLTIIPRKMLPLNPDPGLTLLAAKPAVGAPSWVLDMMQSMAATLGRSKTKAEVDFAVIQAMMINSPGKLLEHAELLHQSLTPETLKELKTLHANSMKLSIYRAMSMEARVKELSRQLPSTRVRAVLRHFLKLSELVGSLGAEALYEKIRSAFDGVLVGDDEKLEALVAEISKGKQYVQSNQSSIRPILSPPEARNEAAWRILEDPSSYHRYLQFQVDDVQNTLPLLFIPLHLPVAVAKDVNNLERVQFYEVVRRLDRAIRGAAVEHIFEFDLVPAKIAALTSPSLWDYASFTGKPDFSTALAQSAEIAFPSEKDGGAPVKFTPNDLLKSAMAGTHKEKEFSLLGLLREDRLEIFSRDEEKYDRLAQSPYWPKEFKLRDLMPASLSDKSPQLERVRRAVVSMLLSPYLRSALSVSHRSIRKLTNPDYNPMGDLAESEIYREIISSSKDRLGGALNEGQREALRWRRFLKDTMKTGTTTTQGWAGFLINYTTFMPIPEWAHALSSIFMIGSMFVDYGTDGFILHSYWSASDSQKQFAGSGVLGGGLVRYADSIRVQQELNQRAEALWARTPMDAWFGAEGGLGMLKSARLFMQQRAFAERASRQKMTDSQKQQMHQDIQHVGAALDSIGLGIDAIGDFSARMQNKKAELVALLKKKKIDQKEFSSAFESWKRTDKAVKEFMLKYRALIEPNPR